MHSSSSAAGMAGEAVLLSLSGRSHGEPKNPAFSATKYKLTGQTLLPAPQDSHHVGFPEAFRLSTKMLLFCHNSLGKQLQADPCDSPMHICMENRYVNSLIYWQIASVQVDIIVAVLLGDDDTHIRLCSCGMDTWHTRLHHFIFLLDCFVSAHSDVHTLRQGLQLGFTCSQCPAETIMYLNLMANMPAATPCCLIESAVMQTA